MPYHDDNWIWELLWGLLDHKVRPDRDGPFEQVTFLYLYHKGRLGDKFRTFLSNRLLAYIKNMVLILCFLSL